MSATTWKEQDREKALAELRIRRLELSLELAHLDWLDLQIRDGRAAPWAVRAWYAGYSCTVAHTDANEPVK